MAIDADRSETYAWLAQRVGAFHRATLQGVQRLLERMHLHYRFTTLTGRIVVFNLLVLAVLVGSIFYFSETEAWLIKTKRESLRTQGEIIAAAIASNARVKTDRIALDPELLDPGNASALSDSLSALAGLEFTIRPERIGPILKRLVQPTGTRARVYDASGELVLDSDTIYSEDGWGTADMPGPETVTTPLSNIWTRVWAWFKRSDLPLYEDIGRDNGRRYPGVQLALQGESTPLLLVNSQGQHVVSVAIPIRRGSTVEGALMISTRGGELDSLLAAQRWSILQVTFLALLAILFSSALLASTIGTPINRLSEAAENVRASLRRHQELPDYTHRADEIGELSGTLREMTNALYRRIEASDRFAADVAHELKNPLTSVRSAAETLLQVEDEDLRQRLANTIQNDVKRLTRLIDDISSASRLDAEMTLHDAQPVNMASLLETLAHMFNDSHAEDDQSVVLDLEEVPLGSDAYIVAGHDSRLGQVVNNLLDNALSFSPPDGTVRVIARVVGEGLEIAVEDEGPGIPPDKLESIFARFYTDRPQAETFGSNSGLGLAISREIIGAHGGTLHAENRYENAGEHLATGTTTGKEQIIGARFVIRLHAPRRGRDRGGRQLGRRH